MTPGAFDTTNNNGDAFVTKVNPAGSAIVFSTFVGGSDFDSASDLVLDAAGNVWFTGGTSSADFPVTAGSAGHHLQRRRRRAPSSQLNATGSALLFSTFLGGSNAEGGADIARDSTGDIYVTGSTFSQDFPATVGAFDRVWNGDLQIFWGDAFVTQARHRRQRLDATVAARRAGRADADVAVQRVVASRSRSRSTGTTCRRRCPTPSRSTTRAPSAHRWSVSRA